MTTNSQAKQGFNFKILGPGLLMASAAIGVSHLVSSTQAGAKFGWQLVIIVLLANLMKYPFFRFGTDYVYDTGESLIAGYAKKSKIYLWIYFILSLCSSVISTGAVCLLAGVILMNMFPSAGLNPTSATIIVMGICWALLLIGRFKLLDSITKVIMFSLTVTTVIAVFIAFGQPSVVQPNFTPTSAWQLASLGFIVSLMGWMPAPLEISAINSMWTAEKIKADKTNHQQGLLDFNIGYVTTTILALFFLALGVFVQYGSGVEIASSGGKYVGQLIGMYTQTIGDWSHFFVAFIAFMCMFGTTITVADGYGRANAECLRLIKGDEQSSKMHIFLWTTYVAVVGLIVVTLFKGQLGIMIKFATTSAFVSAPIFAWLNYTLVRKEERLSTGLNLLSIAGLIFLTGFALFYLVYLMGIIG